MIRWFPTLAMLGATLLVPLRGFAHTRTLSYSTWRENGGRLEMAFRAPWIEFRRAIFAGRDVSLDDVNRRGDVQDSVRRYVQDHVQAFRGEAMCDPSTTSIMADPGTGMVVGTWAASCTGAGETAVKWGLFFDAAPSHVHVARWLREGTASPGEEKILTSAERVWRLERGSPAKPSQAGVAGFLRLGFLHILSGYDHLLFLAGFLLLGLPLRRLIGLITAFTVAHSLSLAAATLGWVKPIATSVESLIGFSIAVIALDGFGRLGGRSPVLAAAGSILVGWLVSILAGGTMPAMAWVGMILFALCYFRLSTRRAESGTHVLAQWLIVFMFGLVHGFGFAGALVSAQFEKGRLLSSLLGFNLGVEMGQLAVLTLLFLAVRLLARLDIRAVRTQYACASVLLAMGLFWFWSRLIP